MAAGGPHAPYPGLPSLPARMSMMLSSYNRRVTTLENRLQTLTERVQALEKVVALQSEQLAAQSVPTASAPVYLHLSQSGATD